MSKTVPLAKHLFERLYQLNCRSVHGVPGDFFLRALDHLSPYRVKLIGNANELCAGYAADGYARAGWAHDHGEPGSLWKPPRVGALLTTYGVGELSAINAIAGAWAENVPLVHIVGTPARELWRERKLIHHSPGDGRMEVYAEMAKKVTCAQADLQTASSGDEAAAMYDEVLRRCVLDSKPVYIQMPSDMVEARVDAKLIEKELDLQPSRNNESLEQEVVSYIADRMKRASNPLILADGLAHSSGVARWAELLTIYTRIRSMCTTSGKGVLNELHKNWQGALVGRPGLDDDTDLVLHFGPILADTNTAGFVNMPAPSVTISFEKDWVRLDNGRAYNLNSDQVLRALDYKLDESLSDQLYPESQASPEEQTPVLSPTSPITQDNFWPRVSSYIQPFDTLLFANGTPLVGSRDMRLPEMVQVIASPIWCSIGQMLPAAQGVAAAFRDHRQREKRTILFEGDGSFQVTCQALSDIIRYRLDVTIFLIDNGGYTYERWLNGMSAEYNDVPAWRYTEAPNFFGAAQGDPKYPIDTIRVETWGELEDVLDSNRFSLRKGLKIIDVVMSPDDMPEKAKEGLRRASAALKEPDV